MVTELQLNAAQPCVCCVRCVPRSARRDPANPCARLVLLVYRSTLVKVCHTSQSHEGRGWVVAGSYYLMMACRGGFL